ncbi:hypothetical protein MSLAZ_1500 [Methanosarcina lacustris Z-7289]|uniref:Uncharacterized protein n=1 Tax=Methanosarcina lacustris Z-7289 TaxID=1434111 RepID=A0A0E3S3J8_9EURY|nr:hypothetical protein MSLAZ_1500 [Methanosarcina lacustris Z-7289]
MLLLLNAHDGVDCLKSLLSSQLIKTRYERCFSQIRSKRELKPGKDTSPPENWKNFRTASVTCLRIEDKKQSNRNPTLQKMRHYASRRCLIDFSKPH